MKRVGLVVLGVLVLLVVAVVAVPRVIDWNAYKPEIAQAVKEATGRNLSIDGNIDVTIVPGLEFEVSGVRLSNRPGAGTADMLTVERVSGSVRLLPLLGRRLVVDSLVVSQPVAQLEVDASGQPNWAFAPPQGAAATAPAAPPTAGEGEAGALPVSDITLADIRLDKGRVTYIDAATGQRLDARDIDLVLALPNLASPLSFNGRLILNEKPVELTLSLDTPRALLDGSAAALKANLAGEPIQVGYAGNVQQRPVPGLDGVFELDIPSVGTLAAWLQRPLAKGQPDPGPLKMRATFTGEGARVALREAVIEGQALRAQANGSFDGSGEVAKIALNIESGVLDIDRYLPPPAQRADRPAEAPAAISPQLAEPAGPRDALAALSDEPIDLSALRGTEADINVAIGGVKAMGFEVGQVAFTTKLAGGVLAADLRELALYGGKVTGKLRLDGSGAALALDSALTIDRVKVDDLARAARAQVPVTGVASGTLEAQARGASPRALAESLAAKAAFDLGGVDVKDAPAGAISEIRVALDLPGLNSPPNLKGSVVYNRERVTLDLAIDPVKKVLSGERFAARVGVTSKLVRAGYDGWVQQQPVPGLDGVFDLDVPSVGRLAAWLGQPLPKGQPDPGPLKMQATFAGEGARVALKQATIEGKSLNARASGSYDGSGPVAKVTLDLQSQVLDIDRYLPPPAEAKKADGQSPAAPAAASPATATPRGDPLAALSAEPIDLSPLRSTDADVKVAIGGVKAMGFEVGQIAFATRLQSGVLVADLQQLGLYGGKVTGRVRLDGSGDALGVETAFVIDKVDVGRLARAAAAEVPVTGIASGTVEARASGASPKALAEALAGKVAVELAGVQAKDPAIGAISEVKMALDLPGLERPPSLKGSVVYNRERVSLDVSVDPVKTVLSGAPFAAKLGVMSNMISARYDGRILQQPVPGLDGEFVLDVPSVGRLASWLGQPLPPEQPDPGPLKVNATFAGDGAKVALREATIEGQAIRARASGSYDGSGPVAAFDAAVVVEGANIDAYLPPRKTTPEVAKPAKGAPKAAAEPAAGWSDEPIDLAPLKKANGKADVRLHSVRYRDVRIRQGHLTMLLSDGVLRTAVRELQFDQGTAVASATVDGSGQPARLDYQVSVAGVEAEPFLKTFADSDRLTGKADFDAQGTARGRSQKELVETLNGDGRFKFLDGAIRGINLAATLRQAQTLGVGTGGEAQQTDFAELSGSFVITNGILQNQDFKLLAPLVRVNGGGVVPLPPQTVDYKVTAKLVGSLKGQGGEDSLAGLPIAISVTGPWSKLSYGVDWKSVFAEAARDPERLKNMPAALRDAAKGFGVALPVPNIPGTEGLGGVLGTLKGQPPAQQAPSAPAESQPQTGPGAVLQQLQRLVAPPQQPQPSAPAPEQPQQQPQQQPAPPDPLKTLKGLFKR